MSRARRARSRLTLAIRRRKPGADVVKHRAARNRINSPGNTGNSSPMRPIGINKIPSSVKKPSCIRLRFIVFQSSAT